MKTPKDIAIMLGALSFIRVDRLRIHGYIPGGRICQPTDFEVFNGMWNITRGFTLIITKDGEAWLRWNQDLPDITDPKINICEPLCALLDCSCNHLMNMNNFLRPCEQFNTQQLLSRMNNPEWEPGC